MLYPDFEESIESLNAHRARHLIVGGYAVAFHCRPRATKDIDVLVDPTVPNAKRVISALASFLGSTALDITVARLTNQRTLDVCCASTNRYFDDSRRYRLVCRRVETS